jgi:hypothetical protein
MPIVGIANTATSVRGGDRKSITTNDTTSRTTLPLTMGRNDNRPWMRPRSELALDTSWPVSSWSWRAKSRR